VDNFIVSARKYRPATFETVVGQQHITNTLKNAIKNNQLAQAFLFCGPRGVGKTTCARILAKTINCTNLQPNGEACGECAIHAKHLKTVTPLMYMSLMRHQTTRLMISAA
jgi:DNA polymerase-3 subunit gamma/tau